ncbi:glycosyltransferase family 1 protein [bacterium]|nr:glycosyltransferase family 1 protein [bacterium]
MIRLLKISDYYQSFLQQSEDEGSASYLQAWHRLMDRRFGWFDMWKRVLEETGHFSVREIVANDALTQGLWWREHADVHRTPSADEILEEQIRQFRPDAIFINNVAVTRPQKWRRWSELAPRQSLLFAYDGLGIHRPESYRELSFILSPLHRFCDRCLEAGVEACPFRPGFPSPCTDLESAEKNLGTVFIGGVGTGREGHGPRLQFLDEIAREAPIEFYLSGLGPGQISWGKQIRRLFRGQVREARACRNLHAKNRGPIFGREMFQALGKSRGSLNYHVAVAGEEGVNMRIYESTGMGSCLLTEERPNLRNLFEVDAEILTYRSRREAMEKIDWIEQNPKKAREIARAGQARTLRDHTLEKQILGVGEILRQKLGSG